MPAKLSPPRQLFAAQPSDHHALWIVRTGPLEPAHVANHEPWALYFHSDVLAEALEQMDRYKKKIMQLEGLGK